MESHFDHELFEFLVELQANNNREWFAEHKERYERHVKQPRRPDPPSKTETENHRTLMSSEPGQGSCGDAH